MTRVVFTRQFFALLGLEERPKYPSMVWSMKLILALLLSIFAVSGSWPAQAMESSIIKVDVDGTEINVCFYRPDGPGPFPLLVMSHGSPRNAGDRAHFGAKTLRMQAEAYVTNGVAVAVPIRRGYGGHGRYVEGFGGCDHPDYYSAGFAGAEDIDATVAALKKRADIAASRVVLMGVSAGGWASLAAGTKGGVLGVVNFAGGRGSRGPDEVCGEAELMHAAAVYGGASHVPELWIYSENDQSYGPAIAHRLFEAFTKAGGQAIFVAAPPYSDDGHKYFDDVTSWKPGVDDFLQRIGFVQPKAVQSSRFKVQSPRAETLKG
jgi:dienelactone hydrolase